MSQQIYGLIGNPVAHSLSPRMHNAAFAQLKLPAEYKLFPFKEEELADFLKNLAAKGISGINVTIPYKEKAISYLDKIDPLAELIGAVNTIKVSEGKLEGFNTDGEGFLKHLEESGFDPQGKKIAILGAGGACRAVAVALAGRKPKSLAVFDIDNRKVEKLVSELSVKFPGISFAGINSLPGLNINQSDLLVNTTPIGMRESDACLIDAKFLHQGILIYDLIYNPAETKLLKIAKERGAKTANGLGMLLYQGVLAFEIWTGKKAPVEVMRRALAEGLKK